MEPSATQTARHQYLDLYGQPLILARYAILALACALLAILAVSVALVRLQAQAANVKPLIIRINDVGRADVVNYDATNYRPQPPELRYFLTRFIVLHYGRQRANVKRDYPDSLFFLSAPLSEAAERSRQIETFLNDTTADDVTITVRNVTLTEWSAKPYKAEVDFVKTFTATGSSQPRRQETFTAQILYTLRDGVSNEYVTVNPLGLQVLDLHLDQAF